MPVIFQDISSSRGGCPIDVARCQLAALVQTDSRLPTTSATGIAVRNVAPVTINHAARGHEDHASSRRGGGSADVFPVTTSPS